MNDLIRTPQPGQSWLPFASLELPAEALTGDALEAWLNDALRSLTLPADFFRKVLASACDAAACLPADAAQVRFLVFTSPLRPADGQTWGFFRMAKKGEAPGSPSASPVHEIALYLYLEGSAGRG